METNLHTESSVNSKICVQTAHRFFFSHESGCAWLSHARVL